MGCPHAASWHPPRLQVPVSPSVSSVSLWDLSTPTASNSTSNQIFSLIRSGGRTKVEEPWVSHRKPNSLSSPDRGIADHKSTMPMLRTSCCAQGKNRPGAATDQRLADRRLESQRGGRDRHLAKNFDLVANAPGDDVTLKKADNHWAEIRAARSRTASSACPTVTSQGAGPPGGELRHRRERGAARDDRAHLFSSATADRFHSAACSSRATAQVRPVSTDGHRLSKSAHDPSGRSCRPA